MSDACSADKVPRARERAGLRRRDKLRGAASRGGRSRRVRAPPPPGGVPLPVSLTVPVAVSVWPLSQKVRARANVHHGLQVQVLRAVVTRLTFHG